MFTEINDSSSQKDIVEMHSQAAASTRKIASYLITRIERSIDDDMKFYKILQQSDRASLTLQRLSAILGHLIPMEQRLLDRKLGLLSSSEESDELQKTEFELIIHFIKDLGLIKDGVGDNLDKIYQDYLAKLENSSCRTNEAMP